jgi:hypothetical protein
MIRCKEFLKDDVNFLKIFYILVALYCQLCGRSTTGYYLDYGQIGEQQLSSLWPELNVPNGYTGQYYQTNIASTNLTDYHIRFLVRMMTVLYSYIIHILLYYKMQNKSIPI